MHKVVRIVVIVAVLLLGGAALFAQVIAGGGTGSGPADVVGGDEETLRELLSRAMASYPAYEGSESTVYVGSLPEDLPFALELPADVRVIGSVVRPSPAPTEIFLDASQAPADVVAMFSDLLSSDDWVLVDNFPGGGFTTTESASSYFCSDSQSALVNINVFELGEGSDARVYISSADNNFMCDQQNRGEVAGFDVYRLLPQLTTPEGVELLQGGGGGGGGGPGFQLVSTQAFLRSELSTDEILSAYNDQLAAFGWEAVDDESSDKLAWSGWQVTDDNDVIWSGTLTLTANATAPDLYTATLMIQEMPEEE